MLIKREYLVSKSLLSSTELNLTASSVDFIDPKSFHDLSHLTLIDLSENRLKNIDAKLFRGVSNLRHLNLNSNHIDFIDQNCLQGLFNLKSINTEYNKLAHIAKALFNNLHSLETINFSHNQIKSTDPKLLIGLNKLKTIHFSHNHIKTIPVELFKDLPRLKSINFSSNVIASLEPATFNDLNRLEKINLSSNRIQAIRPNSFTTLRKLAEINLASNYIDHLSPGSFIDLSNLTKLNLSFNKIKYLFPKTFQNLPSLIDIDLSNNSLRVIDNNSFRGCDSLKTINLRSNQLCSIDPTSFKTLIHLSKIDLSSNNLKSITGSTFCSKKLTDINLSWNNLSNIEANYFRQVILLLNLNLSHNRIESLHENSFKNQTELLRIDLNYNKIKYLDFSLFKNLSNLEYLSVSDNLIDDIDQRTFDGLIGLRELFLARNRLTWIILKLILKECKILERLDLKGNQLTGMDWKALREMSEIRVVELDENYLLTETVEEIKLKLGNSVKVTARAQKNLKNWDLKMYKNGGYEVIEQLGKFKDIYLVKKTVDRSKKVLKKLFDATNDYTAIASELELLKGQPESKYILNCQDLFKENSYIFFVSEWCEKGSLADLISFLKDTSGNLSEFTILEFFVQIMKGLLFLHSNKIIHRNLKPENILLWNDSVKLGDFGLAYNTNKKQKQQEHESNWVINYLAPEVVAESQQKYFLTSDVWSAACVVYEIVELEKAFSSERRDEVVKQILNKKPICAKEQFVILNLILDRMFKRDPLSRASSNEVLESLKDFKPIYN